MMQPSVISGAVENPNSSAPSSAAMTTSRPVFSCPSTARDVGVDFAVGQFFVFAGLGFLCYFDLKFVGARQVLDRDPEAPGRDLLDRRSARVLLPVDRQVPGRILAAFAGVRLAADLV